MRPYALDPRRPGGYRVMQSNGIGVYRETRLSAGMQATLERKQRQTRWRPDKTDRLRKDISDAALRLIVRGTLDPLAATRFDLEPVPCCACGGKSKRLRLKPGKSGARAIRLKAIRLNPDRLP